MAAMRKMEEMDEDTATALAPSARTEPLPNRLLATHEAQHKHRGIRKGTTIALSAIKPTVNQVGFFKLSRELRDQIYQLLWAATPQIKQRYKRDLYDVTYGDVPLESLHETGSSLVKHKVPWLLTCKQMLLEGFVEFHQRSVWHFTTDIPLNRLQNYYIFPLVTPALVREQHLSTKNAQWLRRDHVQEDDTDEVVHIFVPRLVITKNIHSMTASAEEHTAVSKIKLDLILDGRNLVKFDISRNRYLENIKFDLSRLGPLAVHKRLTAFETAVRFEFPRVWAANYPKRLEKALQNLMAELEIIGNALIPAGVTIRQTPASGWAASASEGSVAHFSIKVVKA